MHSYKCCLNSLSAFGIIHLAYSPYLQALATIVFLSTVDVAVNNKQCMYEKGTPAFFIVPKLKKFMGYVVHTLQFGSMKETRTHLRNRKVRSQSEQKSSGSR